VATSLRSLWLLLHSALWLVPASRAAAEPAAADLRIEHVTVVSPERAGPLRDATVAVCIWHRGSSTVTCTWGRFPA